MNKSNRDKIIAQFSSPIKGIAGYVEAHREDEQQMDRSEENELEI